MERESIPEAYLHKFIEKKARISSKLAAKATSADDPRIDDAIYFDVLSNEPRPWLSPDDQEERHDADEGGQ